MGNKISELDFQMRRSKVEISRSVFSHRVECHVPFVGLRSRQKRSHIWIEYRFKAHTDASRQFSSQVISDAPHFAAHGISNHVGRSSQDQCNAKLARRGQSPPFLRDR